MRYRTGYKRIFALSLAAIAALLVLVFVRSRMQLPPADHAVAPEPSEASLSIQRFHHTATRNGKTRWILNAASAKMFSGQNRAVLSDIRMTLFTANRNEVELEAESGVLDTSTRDMRVSGSVVARYPGYVMKTESLHYQHDLHILYTTADIGITGQNARFTADSAKFELDTGRLVLEGRVNAWISGIGTI